MAASAAAALLLAVAASAAPRVETDPRIDLLGAVQLLSGRRPAEPKPDPEHLREARRAFAGLEGHPAVALYAEIFDETGGQEGLAVDLLYYGPPPALAPRGGALKAPYLDKEGQAERWHRFLWELRDFAEVSRFAEFRERLRPRREKIEAAARAELGGLDPQAELERYLGLKLDSKIVYLLSPLYAPSRLSSFILPYPDPQTLTRPVPEGFEVYTVVAVPPREGTGFPSAGFDKPSGWLWQEPLFVFVDPAFHYFERARVADPVAFYGQRLASCRASAANCAKARVVAGVVEAMNRRVFKVARVDGAADPLDGGAEAVSARLAEFESGAAPDLWTFFPRLLGGLSTSAVRQPAPMKTRVRRARDFFEPRLRAALEAEAAK